MPPLEVSIICKDCSQPTVISLRTKAEKQEFKKDQERGVLYRCEKCAYFYWKSKYEAKPGVLARANKKFHDQYRTAQKKYEPNL